MSRYGFNFETLYHLELETLQELCQIIRGDNIRLAPDYDVLIRGCIIPFLRHASKSPKDNDKNAIMRLALITTAKKIGVNLENWNNVSTDHIAAATRRHVQTLIAEKLEALSPQERAEILGIAQNNLYEAAKNLGIPFISTGAVLAGEMSGFGIYLATTTGLKAISTALGITFSWGVYQGATTLLGIILGPVGWALAGLGLVGSGIVTIRNWRARKQEEKLILTVITLLFVVGESPFEFFGLGEECSFTDVKKAFRAMVKTLHPDKMEPGLPKWVSDDFYEKLLRCHEAYNRIENIFNEGQAATRNSA